MGMVLTSYTSSHMVISMLEGEIRKYAIDLLKDRGLNVIPLEQVSIIALSEEYIENSRNPHLLTSFIKHYIKLLNQVDGRTRKDIIRIIHGHPPSQDQLRIQGDLNKNNEKRVKLI